MTALRRTLRLSLPLLAVGAVLVTAATRPAGSARDAAIAWAKANRASLPSTLEGVATFDYDRRRALMHELPMGVQKAIWKEQLAAFVLPEAERSDIQRRLANGVNIPLTPTQVAMVRAVSDSLDRFFASSTTDEERRDFSARLCAMVSGVFSRNNAAKSAIFAHIGPTESKSTMVSNAGLDMGMFSLIRGAAERAGIIVAYRDWCTCSPGNACDCTGIGMSCQGGNCDSLSWGCGCIGWAECTGAGCAFYQ